VYGFFKRNYRQIAGLLKVFFIQMLSGTSLANQELNEKSTTQANEEKGDTMSILHQTIDHKKDGGFSLITRAASLAAKSSESFWFCLSFLLFIVSGPFSAIAVIIGLWSLSRDKQCRDSMVEPARI
jgi:hypothetical protein